MRIFRLGDLPSEWVYVSFKPEFAAHFLNKISSMLSTDEIARYAGVRKGTIQRWSSGAKPYFIRLDAVQRIIHEMPDKAIENWTIDFLQSHIQALKGYGNSKILRNPKFPFREDRHLVRLIVHMIGDGYMPLSKGSTRRPAYTNSNAFLRQQFLNCLSRVFGDVTSCTYSYVDKSGNSRSYVAFSQWLSYILQHWYPDARYDEKMGSLPSAFFGLPIELKAEMVRTFGDDDGHVGANSIRFSSGGATILEQIRRLVVELIAATLSAGEFDVLLKSVGEVKPCQSWFILDVYRPLFLWYAKHIGFTHPERADRLEFQLACDRVWGERGLDGFDLDFLTLVGLREVGSVADIAQRFTLREDFLFEVFQRLRKLGSIERVEKRKFTTFFQTTDVGEVFLERTIDGVWGEKDRVVVRNKWWRRLREGLLKRYGSGAGVARVVGMPETTVRGYLQGRRQWMHGRWVVALAKAVGLGRDEVSEGVVVAFSKKLAPRYEQCDFLAKDLNMYRQFCVGEIGFDEWLVRRRVEVVREEQLLDAEFAEKLESASAIRERIIELAKGRGGEIALRALKEDAVLQGLVANRYSAYLADRMAKLIKQGVFMRVSQGRYRLVQ